MVLASGFRLGSYEILSKIGAGGMGEVYKAVDLNLGRMVAIKVLAPAFAENPDRLKRFQYEAKTLGALDHPNILAIHDLGEHQGSPYLVMELLEGATLRSTMLGGPLPPIQAAELGKQVATGLAAAHERGIIHRDLKPENVFLTSGGLVKILDFGLAKHGALDGVSFLGGSSGITASGTVMGTLAYMSPEQATGKAVDFHSDQWSLGVVLYEMLSGTLPFGGQSAAETLAAIVRDDPANLEEQRPGLSPGLTSIVKRCLSKDPRNRYPSTKELAKNLAIAHLHACSGGTATTGVQPVKMRLPSRARGPLLLAGILLTGGLLLGSLLLWRLLQPGLNTPFQSVAVLPIVNASGDPELDWMCEGLSEQLINQLSRLPRLKVIARSSVLRYKGPDLDLPGIGRDLDVRTLVIGRLVQHQGQSRLSLLEVAHLVVQFPGLVLGQVLA